MPPPEVDLGGDILDFTMGFGYACAVLSTGKIKCWGGYSALAPLHPLGYFPIPTDSIGDDSGEMPPADSFITENPSLLSAATHYIRNPTAPQGTGESIIDLQAYGLATCILLEGGAVMCWGSGQTAFATHLCAIDTQGEASCWGASGDGRLGYGGEAVDLRTERARIKLW